MKIKTLILALSISSLTLNAQNEIDALRYSTQDLHGTARYTSMGGSFGALGGEFSALSSNPAGLGMYQFSEFTFTPTLSLNRTKSYYGNSELSDYKSVIDIGNLGLVFTIPKNNTDWKRVNIGIGWNQLSDYERSFKIKGQNNTSSLADNMLYYAEGNTIDNLNDFHAGPAFWSDLIDLAENSVDTTTNWYLNDNGNYISHINSNTNKTQADYLRSTGNEKEFVFSVGGSYKDQLYIGTTIGFPSINYYENSIYSEHTFEDTIYDLTGFDYEEELNVHASGINLKIGAILRATENLKIGVSVHSPTLYSIEETYNTSITTYFKTQNFTENSPINYFEYELLTPWKANVSASKIFNKHIIISGDYEIVDYSSISMNSNSYAFDEENKIITNLYQRTNNIKLGTEINIRPFIIRAGYSKYGSAFSDKDFSRENFSYGFGVNNGGYFFDIAYILKKGKNEHLLYSEDYIAPVSLVNTNHSLLLTLGFRY